MEDNPKKSIDKSVQLRTGKKRNPKKKPRVVPLNLGLLMPSYGTKQGIE